jgi:hypothetical protein
LLGDHHAEGEAGVDGLRGYTLGGHAAIACPPHPFLEAA